MAPLNALCVVVYLRLHLPNLTGEGENYFLLFLDAKSLRIGGGSTFLFHMAAH